jgi:predicted acylesterase/phospholipase RssA
MAKPLQIAIQGGGAKIFSLLAAMQAMQEYQKLGKIKITRIAGTSAGAFAGCLFGAGIDLEALRQELKIGLAKTIVSPFTPPGKLGYLALLWGKPLWGTDQLRSQLKDIFKRHTHKDGLKIKDLKPEVLVTHTKLNDRRRDVHGPEDFVVDALLDSSGIPFCFRTWKGPKANIVDGGISENLPVEILTQRSKAEDGRIIAISFEPNLPAEPTNLAQFSMALLDTAIDSSMANARFRLGSESVLSLPQPVGTFEFEKALVEGLDGQYDEVMRLTREFLDTVIDPNESAIGDPWADQNVHNLLTLGEVFNAQHRPTKMRYRKQRLEVIANSLRDPNNPDAIDYSTEFDTTEHPIYCHSIALATTEHKTYINKSQWRLYDPQNKEVKILHVPMKDPTAPHLRSLLLFFVPVLPAGSGPYTLNVRDAVKDAMAPLRGPAHSDELAISPRRALGKIGKIEFVIHLPEEYENATLSNKQGDNWGCVADGPGVTKNQPLGFRSLGWEAYNFDPVKRCAIDVKLNV